MTKSIGLVVSSSLRGGVEVSVLETLKQLDRSRFEPCVCVTGEAGPLHEEYSNHATMIDPEELYSLDVVNIYNHLLFAAEWLADPRSEKPRVVQHVYMHYDTLFYMHIAKNAFFELLQNFLRYRHVVCDSPDTMKRIEQAALMLARLAPNKIRRPRVNNTGFDGLASKQRLRLIDHPIASTVSWQHKDFVDRRVLWIGAANWTKGFDRLCSFAKQRPGDTFTVVLKTVPGDEVSQEFRLLHRQLTSLPNVSLRHAVPQDEIPGLMATHNVYFQTSRREGASRALTDAQTAGLLIETIPEEPRFADEQAPCSIEALWE